MGAAGDIASNNDHDIAYQVASVQDGTFVVVWEATRATGPYQSIQASTLSP